MTIRARAFAAILCFGVSSLCLSQPTTEYLKAEPPTGALKYRKVVYVDDGTCPKGEVKEVIGGSQERSIPRSVRCVKRPQARQ